MSIVNYRLEHLLCAPPTPRVLNLQQITLEISLVWNNGITCQFHLVLTTVIDGDLPVEIFARQASGKYQEKGIIFFNRFNAM